ncbi:hypothetical protein BGW39_010787, partial [Mortierella sp. 14UC]
MRGYRDGCAQKGGDVPRGARCAQRGGMCPKGRSGLRPRATYNGLSKVPGLAPPESPWFRALPYRILPGAGPRSACRTFRRPSSG